MKILNKYLKSKSKIKVNKVAEHKNLFFNTLKHQINFHRNNSIQYNNFINNINLNLKKLKSIENLPFLHVNNFKENNLYSVKKNTIYKILNSSGTTNQNLSKIYLDKINAKNQIIALKKILHSVLGENRLPMLIFEKSPDLIDKNKFGAKIAAILGFSIFGRKHTFVINSKNEINYNLLNNFLKNFSNKKFLIFGFTSSIYEYLIKKLNKKKVSGFFKKGILLHGGGWKKLEKIKINNIDFKKILQKKLKISRVINYYGIVEQTGSIFLECEKCNCFHNNVFNDIIIRNDKFNILKVNQRGIVQVLSILPTSYPGNSILLEDEGYLVNTKNKNCLNSGKSFRIIGRIPKAEVRGCSDI